MPHREHTRHFLIAYANNHVSLERTADLLAEEFANGAARGIHPPKQLVDDPSAGERVVFAPPTSGRLIAQPMLFDDPAHGVLLDVLDEQVLHIERGIKVGEAGFVSHQVGDGQPLFAVGAKLRPVVGDFCVVVQQALAHQGGHGNGFQTLAAAEDIGE